MIRLVADTEGRQMLEPVLDPLDGSAGHASRHAHQHEIGKHALLDAETAARVWRRSQPEAVAGHFQRTRNDRVDAERSLEIRQDVVGVLVRVVAGDHAIGLDRRAGVARITYVDPRSDGRQRRRRPPGRRSETIARWRCWSGGHRAGSVRRPRLRLRGPSPEAAGRSRPR